MVVLDAREKHQGTSATWVEVLDSAERLLGASAERPQRPVRVGSPGPIGSSRGHLLAEGSTSILHRAGFAASALRWASVQARSSVPGGSVALVLGEAQAQRSALLELAPARDDWRAQASQCEALLAALQAGGGRGRGLTAGDSRAR